MPSRHPSRQSPVSQPLAPAGLRLLPILALAVFLGAVPRAAAQALAQPFRLTLAPAGEGPATEGSPPGLRYLPGDAGTIRLEFTLPALTIQPVTIEDETFHVIQIDGGGFGGAVGQPMLPTFARLLQIPDRSGVTFTVTAIETTEFPGYRPFPVQPEEGEAFVIDRAAYARTPAAAPPRVTIGAPAIARDLRVVPITFAPVRYDPDHDRIEVAQRIEVEVRFTGQDLRNVQARPHRLIPASFDRLYGTLVPNYPGPREDQEISRGTYVLICPDDAQVIAALQPLVEWRTRQGFEVTLATTTQTGTAAEQIKAWLQNAYDTWEDPPEFIVLVGDADGSIALPCWWYDGGESDHPYVQLEGDDLLADAHIGRISVESVDRLRLYVAKMVGYESTPYMQDWTWYRRACVVGDPNDSGITCVQVMQWLKHRFLASGYTDVDTVFAAPFVTQMVAALNRGDSAFSYRGFYGCSGFTTGHIMALTNGRRMPYAVTVTCGTGGFASGTCISEAWIRAGVPPSAPTGGIAAVSTAGSTHTRYNNCMIYGIWRGVLYEDLYAFGASLTRGKYELFLNYMPFDYTGCAQFTHWNNLMGDPAGEMWTDVPRSMAVTHPATIPLGTNAVTVLVTAQGAPLPDAYVCLWKGAETHAGGWTDADGRIELPVLTPTLGEMRVTVTRHNCRPYLGTLAVQAADRFVGYDSHAIDDDAAGTSQGNGDGTPNPTEVIELPVAVRNFGWLTATAVTGTLISDDPYVTILDASEEFGDIAPGASVWSGDDFDLRIDGGAPHGHRIRLGLDLHSGSDVWHSMIDLPVAAADLVYQDVTLYGFGGTVDPGEAGEIAVRVTNAGAAPAQDLGGTLISDSPWLTVTDAGGTFGTLEIGASGANESDRFAIRAGAQCVPGSLANLRLCLEFSGGARDTVPFVLPVGTASTADPTGPDDHGYYAFDDTDAAYPEAPTYAWVEIDPHHGGAGSDVGLADFGADNDDSRVFDLPFPFVFYGQNFTRVTLCSNGWLAMGATYLENQQNWTIPGAGAPPYLIAPMWDDLYQSGDDRVYQWYDAAQHRYIVEWSRVRTAQGDAVQVFEVILYDPAHYPTPTGDGRIVFQYDTFQNTDYLQHYCTVGIENGDQTDGVLYSYFDAYTPGATPIASGRAIEFTPYVPTPRGTLSGEITNATNGGTLLGGATVHILDTGQQFTSNAEGIYSGTVPIGIHSVVATHPSFAPDTAQGVWILEEQTTELNFSLEDVLPPQFSGATVLPNTGDEEGPYPVTATVSDYSNLSRVTLYYNPRGEGWVALPMAPLGGERYAAAIPGQAQGSWVRYYLEGVDVGEHAATDPPAAPGEAYEFWVLPPLYGDDMESGPGPWSHYAVTDTLTDQWHLSSQRNRTPGGGWSWKFGDEGTGTYADLADGALESTPLTLDMAATLTCWYWVDAESSQAHPGYAYDGGLVETSVDGGEWTQLTPVGGYPYRVRPGSIPGPFPAETPIFSGRHDWTRVHFEIPGPGTAVRFRFRFGSDGAVPGEGWYIDDVEVVLAGPGPAGAPGNPPLPVRLALYPNRPNPCDPRVGTRIRFELPAASTVRLDICDPGGRRVRSLVQGQLLPGPHEIVWDGRDLQGRVAPSGVYFYFLDSGGRRLTRRMMLLR